MTSVAHFAESSQAEQVKNHLRAEGFIPYIAGSKQNGYDVLVMPAHAQRAKRTVEKQFGGERAKSGSLPAVVAAPTKENVWQV